MSDISAEITDSLSRSGKGAMTAPLELANGTVSLPALSFDSDPDSGMYRVGADSIGIGVNGAKVIGVTTSGIDITVGGSAVADIGAGGLLMGPPGGRLTLTTGTPVTTSDVTGATTIYYALHLHNKIQLYSGTAWVTHVFTELSNATAQSSTGKAGPAAVTTNSNYDLFVWNDSGTLRLTRGPLWTSATARGTGAGTTELERLNGRWVNKVAITNGPGAQLGLYVGTVRTDSSSQVNDSLLKRHVWNNYNRLPRAMRVTDGTTSWNYTTAAWQQARASTSNQLDFVIGISEDTVEASLISSFTNTNAGVEVGVSIALDAAGIGQISSYGISPAANGGSALSAAYEAYPGLGSHSLVWAEFSAATGTTTWYGTTSLGKSGMRARVLA